MKLTVKLKLVPTEEQRGQLLSTMKNFNAAATLAASLGFNANVKSRPAIHKLAYRRIRDEFGLSAQLAVLAIWKAKECLSKKKTTCPVCKPYGAITFDQRVLSFKGLDKVSMWVIPCGRILIPIIYGEYQAGQFGRIKGQVDLVFKNNEFYLYAVCDVPEGAPVDPKDFLGIDLGIVNIASDSDGTIYSGSTLKSVRHRSRRLRARLQSKGTASTRKKLKYLSGRERRFATWVNHNISKKIVAIAKDTSRGIALEELKGISDRITVGHKQRVILHTWAFSQLRKFIEYKAKLSGIPIILVDPRNTSRTCTKCGHCEKANRQSQSEFRCRSCGYTANADTNAAENIRRAAIKPAKRNVLDCSR